MEDGHGSLKIVNDHFQAPSCSETGSTISEDSSTGNLCDHSCSSTASSTQQLPVHSLPRSRRRLCGGKNLKPAALMLNLFSLPKLPWSSTDGEDKVEIEAADLESLRADVVDLQEREAYLKAQLEHVDEILRSSRLASYLFIRTRWSTLPGEPPPIDDVDVDDWLPRFIVLHGTCIFIYLMCGDLSPQDSTLLSEITEVGALPSFSREDGEIRYSFYILTRHGLRYECSSSSKFQVNSWMAALQSDCLLDRNVSDALKLNGEDAKSLE